jgi:phosphoribosylformimino-5-aminoimidazole carboxamide ribotide isomerase
VLQRYNDGGSDRKPPGPFELLAAIDLRGGRVVRLLRGDFEAETEYGDDPVGMAGRLVAAGAGWLHIVDLDGAREGGVRQAEVIRGIVAGVGERARCEVAGGLRDAGAVGDALAAGATRVVVGTAALGDPSFAGRLVADHGAGRIVVALDTRAGRAVGEGWVSRAAERPVEEALLALASAGVTRFAVTAIERDGTLAGPDLDLLRRCVELDRGAIVASGGVGSLADLRALRSLGCAGAIVGKALYEGRFTIAEAVAAVADGPGTE